MKAERGFSLIIAVTVIALLTLLGMMVLDAVYVDTQLAGADRAASKALYIAEAGLAWGLNTLREPPYDFDSATPHFDLITALPVIAETDPGCTADPAWCKALAGWHDMHVDQGWIIYGSGSFHVAAAYVKDELHPDAHQNKIVTVRAMGKSAEGARRLLEVVLTTE